MIKLSVQSVYNPPIEDASVSVGTPDRALIKSVGSPIENFYEPSMVLPRSAPNDRKKRKRTRKQQVMDLRAAERSEVLPDQDLPDPRDFTPPRLFGLNDV